ncbi:MAG: response regulator [Erysipelotrichaceae bacterium]|nr:response regulator [Erysipelotrichaceae bacterium]
MARTKAEDFDEVLFKETDTRRTLYDLIDPNEYGPENRELIEKVNEMLKEGNEKYNSYTHRMDLMDFAVGCGVWVINFDEKGKMTTVEWSDGVREILGGYTKEEFPDNDFNVWVNVVHPSLREIMKTAFDDVAALKNGPELSFAEYPMRLKSGEYHWFKAYGKVILREDGSVATYMGTYRDVQAEHEREERLKMVEAIGGIFNFCMYITLSDYTYEQLITNEFVRSADPYLNGNAFHDLVEVLKQTIDDEYKDVAREFYNPDTIQERLAAREKENPNEQVLITQEIYSNTAERWYRLCFIGVDKDDKGNFIHVIFGASDITKDKLLEAEQKRVLADALKAAEHANTAKTVFLNNMSHDIRTPMNAIIGFTSLAQNHLDDEEKTKDYLSKIALSSDHLLSLINEVLDMSRIESGKVRIEESEVHLPDILHDLRTIVQANVDAKQLHLYLDTQDVRDEDVYADKLRLNQVLLNIISNAIKFTKTGGNIYIRLIQRADAPEGYAKYEFHVKDTGIGMSKDFQKHIFEAFSREETATVSGIQESGLGMSIAKNIVDMMGGTITVDSELGVGSEFTVTLTFRLAKNPIIYEKIPEFEGLQTLIVDDDAQSCISIAKMLGVLGMGSEWTTSGKEAILRTNFAKERNEEFAAYIIDWIIPDMSGIEVVRQIRKEVGKDKPIIILTAYDWTNIEDVAKEAGVTAFCSKPLFLSELREVLTKPFVEEKISSGERTFDFTKSRILLVEDNDLNQEIAYEILTEAGFEVDIADDGDIAVDIMSKAEPEKYHLILMDIQMPKMNGYVATRLIRQMPDEKVANIPIVAMTANAFEEDKKKAMDAGMNAHIAKPINIYTLLETLSKILN